MPSLCSHPAERGQWHYALAVESLRDNRLVQLVEVAGLKWLSVLHVPEKRGLTTFLPTPYDVPILQIMKQIRRKVNIY